MSSSDLTSLAAYLRALAPASTSPAHAARLEAWAADVERVVAELAELHAMASAHNPTPPSPEVRAEHERRLAEILERIGPEKAWANLMEGIHARSRLSPDGRAEFDALWDRWDDERDPHEKAKLQMQLAEWCASLVSHGESADRECAELYNCEEHRPQDQPRVAGERHEHRPGSAGDDARRLRGATDPVVVATPPAAPSATEATFAPGARVLYSPSLGGEEYAATVDGEPWRVGPAWVVALRDLEPAYAMDHHPGTARTTVAAAELNHLRPMPHPAAPDGQGEIARLDLLRERARADAAELRVEELSLRMTRELEDARRYHADAAARIDKLTEERDAAIARAAAAEKFTANAQGRVDELLARVVELTRQRDEAVRDFAAVAAAVALYRLTYADNAAEVVRRITDLREMTGAATADLEDARRDRDEAHDRLRAVQAAVDVAGRCGETGCTTKPCDRCHRDAAPGYPLVGGLCVSCAADGGMEEGGPAPEAKPEERWGAYNTTRDRFVMTHGVPLVWRSRAEVEAWARTADALRYVIEARQLPPDADGGKGA